MSAESLAYALTVESLCGRLQEMVASGHLSPKAKVLVEVQQGDGFTGAETFWDFVTINQFGQVAILTPYWKLAQHFEGKPNRQPEP